jgi:SulP family sulfate permease
MKSLESLHEICQKEDITLLLSHVNEQPMSVMKKSGFFDKVGAEHFLDNIDMALEYAAKIVPQED